MGDDRLFIKADRVYSDRFLHSDEMFKKEKNWNINLPKERQFANGECIITDKNDTSYSIDELINLLNYFHRTHYPLKQFQNKVAEVIEGKMGDNVCNDYKMEVLKEIWNELDLDEVWFE